MSKVSAYGAVPASGMGSAIGGKCQNLKNTLDYEIHSFLFLNHSNNLFISQPAENPVENFLTFSNHY